MFSWYFNKNIILLCNCVLFALFELCLLIWVIFLNEPNLIFCRNCIISVFGVHYFDLLFIIIINGIASSFRLQGGLAMGSLK